MAKTLTRGGASSALGVDAAVGKHLLTDMLLIRRFEEKAAEAYTLGKIGGFLHLYIGEEAVAVGTTSVLRPDDYAISAYREHGHCLAKGSDPKRVMAELYGRRDGLSKGKGGSMHLFDRSTNFLGGHAIVGAHLPIAAGVAFALKYQGGDQVIVCYFGDGAAPGRGWTAWAAGRPGRRSRGRSPGRGRTRRPRAWRRRPTGSGAAPCARRPARGAGPRRGPSAGGCGAPGGGSAARILSRASSR